MASTFATAAATPTFTVTILRNSTSLSPTQQNFIGLTPIKPTFPCFAASRSRRPARSVVVRAGLNPFVVISLSTGLSLFLERFMFFNFQRENVAKQVPGQNDVTHFKAGDTRAKEYFGLLKSNDPMGFNIVDVLAWGSIGHIVAYYMPPQAMAMILASLAEESSWVKLFAVNVKVEGRIFADFKYSCFWFLPFSVVLL